MILDVTPSLCSSRGRRFRTISNSYNRLAIGIYRNANGIWPYSPIRHLGKLPYS
jgi:hypothetical protein